MTDSTSLSATAKQLKNAQLPSDEVIQRILNFSKSIEVKHSAKLGAIVTMGN